MDAASSSMAPSPGQGQTRLGWEDAAVIVIYFIFVLAVGLWVSGNLLDDICM